MSPAKLLRRLTSRSSGPNATLLILAYVRGDVSGASERIPTVLEDVTEEQTRLLLRRGAPNSPIIIEIRVRRKNPAYGPPNIKFDTSYPMHIECPTAVRKLLWPGAGEPKEVFARIEPYLYKGEAEAKAKKKKERTETSLLLRGAEPEPEPEPKTQSYGFLKLRLQALKPNDRKAGSLELDIPLQTSWRAAQDDTSNLMCTIISFLEDKIPPEEDGERTELEGVVWHRVNWPKDEEQARSAPPAQPEASESGIRSATG